MYRIQDLWQSILTAFIRFWDNRFQLNVTEDTNYLLKLELERSHKLVLSLIDKISSRPESIESPTKYEEEPKPIGPVHWRAQAAKLTADSIKRRKELEAEMKALKVNPKANESIEALEKELGVEPNAISS